MLNENQQRAHALALSGKSFFLTGPGGSGKSYVLTQICTDLRLRGKEVALTAMTGCAALLLGKGANTLHSWAGIGLGRESASALVSLLQQPRFRFLRSRWQTTHTLIIDEVSMLLPELLEKLDTIAKALRRDMRPMGGLQVILVGDFFQLPPISKTETAVLFETPLWREILEGRCIELTQIERQRDPLFLPILAEARRGALSVASCNVLRSRQGLAWDTLEIRPTLLFSRKVDVERINQEGLAALTGPRHTYKIETLGGAGVAADRLQKAVARLDKNAPYVEELVLAEGAQVMLIKNQNVADGLVNGSRGVVTGFADGKPMVKFKTGVVLSIGRVEWESDDIKGVSRRQIPLRLAYALTIHKAQGATLDCVCIDIGRYTFDFGQAYVALSRVRDLESLYVLDFDPAAFFVNEKVVAYYDARAATSAPAAPDSEEPTAP